MNEIIKKKILDEFTLRCQKSDDVRLQMFFAKFRRVLEEVLNELE